MICCFLFLPVSGDLILYPSARVILLILFDVKPANAASSDGRSEASERSGILEEMGDIRSNRAFSWWNNCWNPVELPLSAQVLFVFAFVGRLCCPVVANGCVTGYAKLLVATVLVHHVATVLDMWIDWSGLRLMLLGETHEGINS